MTKISSEPNEISAASAPESGTTNTNQPKVIFFGNGPLADFALKVLREHCNIIFHAKTKADLETVKQLKLEQPDAFGILASFGVLLKSDLLDLFEPEGILNLHPSLLPAYRGASPIESAILSGDNNFSYSIMKLSRAMDAGPIYHQATLKNLTLNKSAIYQALAEAGANWLVKHLSEIRQLSPTPQNDSQATFTTKLDKSLSVLHPEEHSASEILRQIVAYQDFPKSKFEFFGKTCIILDAHIVDTTAAICDITSVDIKNAPLMLKCKDRNFVAITRLQPEGKKPMDAISFMNGYGRKR